VDRLLTPRRRYRDDYDDGYYNEPFDPSLRTVYRKMDQQDLDEFVNRMYTPYKNSVPRRDIYDEKKALEKKVNALRDERPKGRPNMVFKRGKDEKEEKASEGKAVVLPEHVKQEAHNRLYQAAAKHDAKLQALAHGKLMEDMGPGIGFNKKLKRAEEENLLARLRQKESNYTPTDDKPPKILTRDDEERMLAKLYVPKKAEEPPQDPELGRIRNYQGKVRTDIPRKLDPESQEAQLAKLLDPIRRPKHWGPIPDLNELEKKKKMGAPEFRVL